ncbi:OsmC family protein [Brachybacterium timonense]|uniref:OsmC family protein n=1 Tax=Brachybacterium timonense TaxID=2050896 RepID=UPI000D0B772E|nr:OsmC family protein [Brachybacterium timonense]
MPTFSITSTSTSPTRLEAKARQFTITVDEPPSLGGADAGPNPVEFVLAALAGCYNVVVQMVAQEQGVSLSDLRIDLEGDLDPSKLMGKDVTTRAGYDGLRMTIHASTDADDATMEALLAAVEERCPVSDNLRNPTPVSVAFARA